MVRTLRAKPVSVQVKCGGTFVPPRYDLYKVETSAELATKCAESYGLKSTQIIINQNSASTQYLSFRYFLQGEPIRFIDVSIGIDQAEIIFSTPANEHELISETSRAWGIIFGVLQPIIKGTYFEATLHCETVDISAKEFLNEHVFIQSDTPGMHRGFSITSEAVDVSARLSLDVSGSIKDGLYVVFVYVTSGNVRDMGSFEKMFSETLSAYHSLQGVADIQLLEPD